MVCPHCRAENDDASVSCFSCGQALLTFASIRKGTIAKPNEFDAGIRATGATYSKTFTRAGVVELLCKPYDLQQIVEACAAAFDRQISAAKTA